MVIIIYTYRYVELNNNSTSSQHSMNLKSRIVDKASKLAGEIRKLKLEISNVRGAYTQEKIRSCLYKCKKYKYQSKEVLKLEELVKMPEEKYLQEQLKVKLL